MSAIILQGLSVSDLRNLISEVIREQGLSNPMQPVCTGADYLTRQEVAKILQISLPTLHDYTKRGFIPAYRIGNKVRYIRSEVDASLGIIKSLKHKHHAA